VTKLIGGIINWKEGLLMTKNERYKEEKLRIAREIIKISKELGFYQPMSNGQYITAEALAAAHNLHELRESHKNLTSANRR
jgi:predicted translin family RNA/ssDNA-binding protein